MEEKQLELYENRDYNNEISEFPGEDYDKKNLILQNKMTPLSKMPNDPENIVITMKWLQYLTDKHGGKNLPNILEYYVDIRWITDDVRLDLLKYSKGITNEHNKKVENEISNISTNDHIQSFLYIQKLKGNQLSDRFLWKIDRKVESIEKSIDHYKITPKK